MEYKITIFSFSPLLTFYSFFQFLIFFFFIIIVYITSYTYERSPVMSTYLLAFIIGELESISGQTSSGTEVNVYCTPGKTDQCAFALDTAIKVLDFFTEYMGISYPLPKCDMVGIPDFASGAMENWGLVTYRETALFANDDSSASARQRVAYVVAHELAHQWFGNLVTMEWWSDLWLNEGFATWAGTLAVDYVFPHWDTWTQFSQDDGSYALSTGMFKIEKLKNEHGSKLCHYTRL